MFVQLPLNTSPLINAEGRGRVLRDNFSYCYFILCRYSPLHGSSEGVQHAPHVRALLLPINELAAARLEQQQLVPHTGGGSVDHAEPLVTCLVSCGRSRETRQLLYRFPLHRELRRDQGGPSTGPQSGDGIRKGAVFGSSLGQSLQCKTQVWVQIEVLEGGQPLSPAEEAAEAPGRASVGASLRQSTSEVRPAPARWWRQQGPGGPLTVDFTSANGGAAALNFARSGTVEHLPAPMGLTMMERFALGFNWHVFAAWSFCLQVRGRLFVQGPVTALFLWALMSLYPPWASYPKHQLPETRPSPLSAVVGHSSATNDCPSLRRDGQGQRQAPAAFSWQPSCRQNAQRGCIPMSSGRRGGRPGKGRKGALP